MSRSIAAAGALALGLLLPPLADAATDADLADIREQIRQLKAAYEARIEALERRLEGCRNERGQRSRRAAIAPKTAAPAAASLPDTTGKHVRERVQSGHLRRAAGGLREPVAGPERVRHRRLRPERRHRARQARLQHRANPSSALSANVDDKIYGNLIFSLSPDNTVEVEEAYGMYTALAARIHAEIRPLPVRHRLPQRPAPARLGLLRRAAALPGIPRRPVQERRHAIEMGRTDRHVPRARRAKSATARAFPGTDRNSNGIGSGAAYAHAGGEIGASNEWRAGSPTCSCDRTAGDTCRPTSPATDAQSASAARASSPSPISSGSGRRTATRMNTNFKLQGEYFWRKRGRRPHVRQRRRAWPHQHVELLVAAERLVPRRRLPVHAVLARRCALRPALPGTVDYGANGVYLAQESFNPQRYSVMFDYTPSEFSRFRVQWQQSRIRPDLTDNQLFIQYILTLGAHGAHKF